MGNERKLQTDDPMQSEKRNEPNSSQGSTVGADGVITLPEVTVVGDPTDANYDQPIQDDWLGNELVSAVAAIPEALAEGVVMAVIKEAGAADAEELGGIIWGWLTTPTPSVDDLPSEPDPMDAGTDSGSDGNADGGDQGDDGEDGGDGEDDGGDGEDDGEGGEEENESGDGGDDVGASRDDQIAAMIARGFAAGGVIPSHDDRGDGDGSGQNNRDRVGSLVAEAMALGGIVGPHDDGGDSDGTGRNDSDKIAARIGRALAAGVPLPQVDEGGDGDGTGRPLPTFGTGS